MRSGTTVKKNDMKKLSTYIVILFSTLLLAQESYAQTPQLNEEKYWAYRDRLRNEFMIGIGPGMGMSIPASVRDTVGGILQWTDCTIAHGQYIAVLALEYAILDSRSYDTDQTIEELFYALYALNRLDYTAEPFFGGQPSLNGFFMRDDISEDSLDMDEVLEHLNQDLPEHKITGLDSDFMDEIPRNNEESLDQAILLITGLAMVNKWVPEDVVYEEDGEAQEFQDFETSLNLEAGHMINRIVNYMKEGDSSTVHLDPSDPNLYGIQGYAFDFIIKNPVTMIAVLRGENAFLISKGFTSAKYHTTGLPSPTTDLSSDTMASALFLTYEGYIVPNDQDFKIINLNAMANYWPGGLQEDSTNSDYNARNLGPRAQFQGYEWIPMLHQLMFGQEENYLMSELPPDTTYYNDPAGFYEYLLNLAPPEGPYNYENGLYPNWEWSSTSRTIQPNRRGEMSTAFKGNYDGLDYMLYYNMHTLVQKSLNTIIEEPADGFSIYPNPFSDKIKIESPYSDKQIYYQIISIGGQVQASGFLNGQHSTIHTGMLKPGLYIIMLRTEHNHTITRKIIKH